MTGASTRPITGSARSLNVATSAAGGVKVELQDADGRPLAGHGLEECDEIIGDSIERTVTWKGSADVAALAGKPVRMKLAMKEADVFAFRFKRLACA
jgi:hypothetical protein